MSEKDELIPATEDFTKGFNEGYTMAELMPDLAEKIALAMGEDDRGQGFKAGRDEMVAERARENRPGWMRNNPYLRSLSADPELDRDNPDPEPDIEPEP